MAYNPGTVTYGPPTIDADGRQYSIVNGQRVYSRPTDFEHMGSDGGLIHNPDTWNSETGEWEDGGLNWTALADYLGMIGVGGGTGASIAAGGGGAAAAGTDASLSQLGPSTTASMAATSAAGAAPDSLAATLGGGAATGGASALTGGTTAATPGLGSKFLDTLTSSKGLASLASLFGPALAEAFAPTPQTWTGFTGANDPSAAESATTDKLNAMFSHLTNRNISLPDANLAAPTAHYSGGALPMDFGIKPTTSGPFGNPGGAQPNTGGLSTQDLGGLPGSPNVSRVASPGVPPTTSPAIPADYAAAHQALQLLKPRNGIVQ